jgi:hypothetical protein
MKLKDMVIRICDYLCYTIFALVCITAFLTGMVNPIYGAVVGIVGLILFSLMAGLWFVLSSISDSAQRSAILQEQQLEVIKKLNRTLEAHRELQFLGK